MKTKLARKIKAKGASSLKPNVILTFFLNRFPIWKWISTYKANYILYDLIAGVTVAFLHVPQGLAYGLLADLPPILGLYVSTFPPLFYAIFGTSLYISTGTFSMASLMIREAISQAQTSTSASANDSMQLPNSTLDTEKSVEHAAALSVLVGIFQIIVAMFNAGFLTIFLTPPLVSAFTCSSAMLVIASQIPQLLGIRLNFPSGVGAFPIFWVKLFKIIKDTHVPTLVTSLICIIVLVAIKKLSIRYIKILKFPLPAELIVLIFSTVAVHFLNMRHAYNIPTVGKLSRGLPKPRVPNLTSAVSLLKPSIIYGITITSLSLAVAISLDRKKVLELNSNQEIFAHGMTNILSSFFLCFPSSVSISRSLVQQSSGGKTQMASFVSSIVLIAVLLWVGHLFFSLPVGALSAIVVVNLESALFLIRDGMRYWRMNIYEWLTWMFCFVGVLIFNIDFGLAIGLVASLVVFVCQSFRPPLSEYKVDLQTEKVKAKDKFEEITSGDQLILRFEDSLNVYNSMWFKRRMTKYLERIKIKVSYLVESEQIPLEQLTYDNVKHVVLDCSSFNRLDSVGVKTLISIHEQFKSENVVIYFAGIKDSVMQTLEKNDFFKKIDKNLVATSFCFPANFLPSPAENVTKEPNQQESEHC